MINPKQGNRTILLLLAVTMAIAAIFVQWGIVTVTADDLRESITINGQKVSGEGMGNVLGGMMSSMFSGMNVPVSGTNGNLVLGPIKIPYWVAISAVIVGLLLTITNTFKFSDVPRILVFGLLISGIVAGIWAVIVFLANGSMGIGALLLITSSIIGLTQQRPLNV